MTSDWINGVLGRAQNASHRHKSKRPPKAGAALL
jgi:hypothetical protein